MSRDEGIIPLLRSSRKIMEAYLNLENEVFIDFGISNSRDIRSYLEAELYSYHVSGCLRLEY